MANQYIQYPPAGNGNIYPTLGDFPASAPTGTLAIAADSSIVYEFYLGSWQPIAEVSGSNPGTVTSVGLSLPASVFNVTGSPVTTSGTLTGAFATQTAKTFLAGPTSGAPSAPSFRALLSSDLSGIVGNLSDAGTDGISVANGTGAVIGIGTSISQHVADTSHNGYLSSTDWNTFNNKQSALTLGDLTDAGTDGITITGGTGAVVGSGTSIAQHVADASHNGYLSSADWSTFNSKQAAGNYITALTGDATASGPGSAALTLATVNSNVGSFGSSTSIPSFTVNGKGLITAASGNAVIAPAGTLSGTALNSTVVSSSLTSVGTIASGTWNGTAVTPTYGGSSPATRNLYVDGNRTDTYTATGAINLPFKTIQAAINQVIANGDNSSHGYTIQIAPFAYGENLTFNSSLLYNLVLNSNGGQSNSLQNTSVSSITSSSNNTQLATLVFIGITVNGAVNLTGDINNTNFGSAQVLFNNCTFNNSSSTITFNNVNNINMYNSQIQGSGSVATYTNIAFSYMEGPEGFNNNTTLHMVDNPGGNVPSQYSGNYMLFYIAKFYGTMTIDAGSEVDMLQSYAGSSSSITNNGIIHSWTTNWGGTVTLNNGSTMRTRADSFHTAPTVNSGATFLYQDIGYNDTNVQNTLKLTGATSGTISILPQAAAGTYNFNMPTTAGTAGQVLTSQGGGSSAMTWVTPGAGSGTVTSVSVTSANGFAGTVATATTTPAISISTTVNSPILAGNGTAISAATTTGSGSTAVLSNNPAITGTWTLTDAGSFINAATSSKVLKLSLVGMTAATTLTLSSSQSTTQTLTIPNITGADTLATLGLPQTFSAATTFSAASTALTVTNGATIGTLTLTNALSIGNGGTGQTTASAAFNALSPMTTLGDIIYGGTSGAGTRLAGNTTSTKNFLVQTGTGSVSAAPSWGTIAAGDVPTLNQNTTGTASNITASSNATLTTLSALTSATSLASVGTITTGIWNGTTIAVANGGTGQTTLTNHGVLVGAGTSAVTQLAAAAAGTVLTGQGTGSDPSFSATPTLGVNGTTTGQLNMATNTGSGQSVTIQNRSTTSAWNFNLPTTAGSAGQCLTSQGGASNDMTWTTVVTSVAPTVQTFTGTGSTVGYLFTISTSTTCAVNDTYTNNGHTYTVIAALSAQSGAVFWASGASAPQASGTLTRATGSGTASITFSAATAYATYTTPSSPRTPTYIRVRIVGGGGGGGGSGTTASTPGTGGTGGSSYFGANIIVANGGTGGNGASAGLGTTAGGTASLGAAVGVAIQGGTTTSSYFSNSTAIEASGGNGAASPFGGAGGGANGGQVGGSAVANTGSGAGGGGTAGSSTTQCGGGAGGAAGGYADAIISSPAATYPYIIGSGGIAGTAGTAGQNGGVGGSGYIIVEEFYS